MKAKFTAAPATAPRTGAVCAASFWPSTAASFGARSAISGGAKFIRPVFITVVLGLTVRLAWQHWFGMA